MGSGVAAGLGALGEDDAGAVWPTLAGAVGVAVRVGVGWWRRVGDGDGEPG
ncbi:MAG TPA: hypothetical protein VG164_05170 [Trebonia sp.]|nr:hypothetical protein [Trebonia sp.]